MQVRIVFSLREESERSWNVWGELCLPRLPTKGDHVMVAGGLPLVEGLGFPRSLRVESILLHPAMKRGEETYTLTLEDVSVSSPQVASALCDLLERHLDFVVDGRD